MKYINNRGGRDEWYTPPEAIQPIIEYLKPGSKILCPFDTAESNFVSVLMGNGFNVLYSHIMDGIDFFNIKRPDVDYIISNPPFSKRDDILNRLYEWEIPFAMIFDVNGLFDSKTRSYLGMIHGAEVLYLYPRIKFIDENGRNNPPFQSCYWCHGILPEKLIVKQYKRGDTDGNS